MKLKLLVGLVLVGALVGACGPVEVRIDETKGVPSVTGSQTVDIPTNFSCGTPITSNGYTVTTTKTATGCQFAFDQDVSVLKASDYTSIPELNGAANLVQRVELTVKKLTFTDATTGATLDLATRVTSATLSVNGQQLADKAALTNLPKVVTLSGTALDALKAKVDARQPASVHATAVVEVPNTPAPPTKLKVDYDAQPAIIVGPGKVL